MSKLTDSELESLTMVVKALSTRQPWASPILGTVPGVPVKDVENRNWKTNYRGRLYIHAAKTFDHTGYEYIQDVMGYKLPPKDWFPTGGIIGHVNLVDCVGYHESEWFQGDWGFVLANPNPIDFIPMSGQLNIFNVDIDERRPSILVPGETIVLNMRRDAEIIKVARQQGRVVYIGRPSRNAAWGWGNPFTSEPGTKAAVVVPNPLTAHRQWLDGTAYRLIMQEERAWQLAHLHELRGKALVCFCKPADCHGDYLKELAGGG
jgi:hypothetical protein